MATYYVYSYRDEDNKTVYVGKGRGDRAWKTNRVGGEAEHCAERLEWKEEQLSKGRLPCDWVVIEQRGLTSEEALEAEKALTNALQPLLNKTNVIHTPFWTAERVDAVVNEARKGISGSEIARRLEITHSTVCRKLRQLETQGLI